MQEEEELLDHHLLISPWQQIPILRKMSFSLFIMEVEDKRKMEEKKTRGALLYSVFHEKSDLMMMVEISDPRDLKALVSFLDVMIIRTLPHV